MDLLVNSSSPSHGNGRSPLRESLEGLAERLEHGERLSAETALSLWREVDVLTLGLLAGRVARARHARRVSYGQVLRLGLRPLCAPSSSCRVCDAVEQAAADSEAGEVHVLGSGASLEQVLDTVRRLRARLPGAWIAALTAGDLSGFASQGGLEDILRRLQAAGVDQMLGTHEEVYTSQGRALLAVPFPDDDEALAVHAAAHRAGLVSIATCLYDPGEDGEALVASFAAIREAQRRTGGFSVFAPLPRDLGAGTAPREVPSGYEDVRVIALARLFFDNIPHIRVPWLSLGLKMGQVALSFGADDLGWTPLDPHVRAFAPPTSFSSLCSAEIERMVAGAGRSVERVDGAFRPFPTSSSPRPDPDPTDIAAPDARCTQEACS